MKLKSFIVLALAVVTTAGVWLWFHHPSRPAEKSVARLMPPDNASLPKLIPANAPKMVTIIKAAKVQPPELPLPASDWSAIQKIVDARAGYRERLNAIASLSTPLTGADWTLLKKFLLKPDSLDGGQLGQVIKNRLLDVLCAMNPLPSGLGDVLAKIYQDSLQNEVVRDYAVQHMAAFYEAAAGQNIGAAALQSVQAGLWEAANETTSGSTGGTALLALKRLSQEYSTDFDQGKIAAMALQMAGNPIAGELNHITAFQVCAQLGTADALPVVLKAAQKGETISVQLSAIGALGQLGGKEQIPFLNSVLNGTQDRLKPAAQHALEQIALRQTQLASQK